MGFRPASLEEARAQMPFDVLVPEDIPDGFQLDARHGTTRSARRGWCTTPPPSGRNCPAGPPWTANWSSTRRPGPHLWGITGDIVVTGDGDLTPDEFVRLAESLRG